MSGFRRGTGHIEERKGPTGGVFEAGLLPDAEKERLCRSLLAEFGATHVRPGADGELIHGCLLPFGNHKDQDRNPTASLNYKRLAYNCLGCGAGGGLLWFIALCRDETGEAARKWIEDQTGTGADDQSLSSLMAYFDAVYDTRREVRPPMPRMDAKVLTPWLAIHPYMTDPKPDGRGVLEETLMEFKVGYGEIRTRLSGAQSDTFVQSHRIVIPHFWKGTLVGWQTRRLVQDGTPKYLSSPDFPKEQTLYNYRPTAKRAVICEAPMSVLSKAHLEPHIEGTFGAKVTDEQVRLISMHPRVVLFMDNDEAGWNATERIAEALDGLCVVYVAHNPWKADPADLSDEDYLSCVVGAEPYALWRPPDPDDLKTYRRYEEVSA